MNITNRYPCIQIDASELHEDRAFLDWFFNMKNNVATWDHRNQGIKILGEYSDFFTWVDHGEGSDSDMPEHVWKKIIETAGPEFAGIAWLTFH